MKILKLILLMGFISALFGCKSNVQKSELIELTANQMEEEGWQDLVLSITQKKLLETGYWDLTCKAKYRDQIIGIRIYILEGLEPGIVGDDLDNTKFVREAVKIESIGRESDNFIKIVSKLYGQEISENFTDSLLSYTIFPLNEFKANLENGQYKFKLFFDDTEQYGLYSEMYLNPNFPNGTIELNEKDEEYRKNIVLSMTKK
jgi:hypothetical protein